MFEVFLLSITVNIPVDFLVVYASGLPNFNVIKPHTGDRIYIQSFNYDNK